MVWYSIVLVVVWYSIVWYGMVSSLAQASGTLPEFRGQLLEGLADGSRLLQRRLEASGELEITYDNMIT